MPKTDIDYSNTIIYQIACKDVNVKDVYIGHTTNFVQRKHAHKQSCTNDKSANYNCKLYNVIRNNGGWSNWKMVIITFLNCHDHYEARQKEQEYFISLHATLNSIEPMPKPKLKQTNVINESKKSFYCHTCDIYCNTLKIFESHIETIKHKKKTTSINGIPNKILTNPNEKMPENAENFICIICDFKCSKQSNFLKHITTLKHKILTNPNEKMPENADIKIFQCICGKKYTHLSSLCAHKKKCITTLQLQLQIPPINPTENMIVSLLPPVKSESEIKDLTNLVIEVVKNNSEFQKQMFDMCKNMQSTIISNSNCNNNTTNNNTFNLQVFLNEYCKDAMNISEFIESFDLQISDLENVGRLGYIEGMSNIIISKINELEVNKRPIHCSDLKREIIYIKDDNIWEREDGDNTKFRRVIKKVTGKNIGKLSDWRNMYPDCMDIESEYNEIYLKLIKAAIGPNDTVDNETKIMKKIVKHVVIDKKALTGEAL